MTAETVAEDDVVLCVGDTAFLDYGRITAKKEGYGPIGKGSNGLITQCFSYRASEWSIDGSIVAKTVESRTKAETITR